MRQGLIAFKRKPHCRSLFNWVLCEPWEHVRRSPAAETPQRQDDTPFTKLSRDRTAGMLCLTSVTTEVVPPESKNGGRKGGTEWDLSNFWRSYFFAWLQGMFVPDPILLLVNDRRNHTF